MNEVNLEIYTFFSAIRQMKHAPVHTNGQLRK